MDINTTREVIEDLIEINNDRITGYQKAQEDIKEYDALLVPVFADIAEHQTQLNIDHTKIKGLRDAAKAMS